MCWSGRFLVYVAPCGRQPPLLVLLVWLVAYPGWLVASPAELSVPLGRLAPSVPVWLLICGTLCCSFVPIRLLSWSDAVLCRVVRGMMFGFGDSLTPSPASLQLMEEMVIEYIVALVTKVRLLFLAALVVFLQMPSSYPSWERGRVWSCTGAAFSATGSFLLARAVCPRGPSLYVVAHLRSFCRMARADLVPLCDCCCFAALLVRVAAPLRWSPMSACRLWTWPPLAGGTGPT